MQRLLPLTLAVALVGAACGGDDDDAVSAVPVVVENVDDAAEPATDTEADTDAGTDTDTGSGAAAPTSSDEELALEFADCMRDEGIDFADPVVAADGSVDLFGGFDEDTPPPPQDEAQIAFEVCGDILDGTTLLPNVDDILANEEAFLEFARCLRDEGLDVDDPDLSNLGGGPQAIFGENFDPDDPSQQDAIQVCAPIMANVLGG